MGNDERKGSEGSTWRDGRPIREADGLRGRPAQPRPGKQQDKQEPREEARDGRGDE